MRYGSDGRPQGRRASTRKHNASGASQQIFMEITSALAGARRFVRRRTPGFSGSSQQRDTSVTTGATSECQSCLFPASVGRPASRTPKSRLPGPEPAPVNEGTRPSPSARPAWRVTPGVKSELGHLRTAGVDRADLFERSKRRMPIRLHDLRATFVTVSLANGKAEQWVSDRTGHRSSQMLALYTQQFALSPARSFSGVASLGRVPSLHRLDGRYPRLRRLLAGRYYERVRLLGGLLRITACAFPPVPPRHHQRVGPSEVSRFPCMRHVCACRTLGPRRER